MAYSGGGGFLARGLPPTGLAALLAKPGLRDALLATGSALLQQRDVPGGSLAGGLGRALPMGMQALQQGQQKAEYEQLLASAPPEMRQLLTMLGPERGIPALMQLMQPKEPAEFSLGPGEKRFRGDQEIASVPIAEAGPEPLPPVLRGIYHGMGIDDPNTATPEQRAKALATFERLEGPAPGTTVNVGAGGDVTKLPVGVQAGVVGAQGVRDSLDRFEEYAKEWLDLPKGERAAGQAGMPDPERDLVLGNLDSVRQELVLNLKNLAELGVLAGPDMDILNSMIGDPTGWAALVRSPDFTLTKIKRVREFVENKVRNYERTYGITVPGGAGAASATPSADPLGIRRP